MAQEVPSLFRDSDAPSSGTETNTRVSYSADRDTSDAAKEARLLSQLLLLFSVKRQHSAVAAMFPHHLETVPAVDHDDAPSPQLASASSASSALDAQLHPATDAAIASSLLRSRPSERELIQQFLLLGDASRNKVTQSLFVIPPSLLDDFAVVLQFFLRVLLEAHSDSQQHHYDSRTADDDDHDHDHDSQLDQNGAPRKTCSWAQNGSVRCVDYTSDESATSGGAGAPGNPVTTAVFSLPEGFHACLVETYGSVQRSKCEEVWHGDHMAYRCRTCGLSDSSCMCLACFDPDDHVGHDYRVYRCSSGGCCDCGDPLAWRPDGFCKKHRSTHSGVGSPPPAAPVLSELEQSVVHTLVRRVVTFSVNVLREVYVFSVRTSTGTSESPRALPKTGRRRSSFPSVMQVHLDRLQQSLAWLQAIAMSCVPYRQIVTELFMEELPPGYLHDGERDNPRVVTAATTTHGQRPLVVLDVFLKAGVLLPVEMCDTLGVLYLKLLFDQSFKQTYTCHFVDWYPYFIELYLTSNEENNDDGMRSLSRFIDRLFCQLFHSTAQLEELERASQLRDQRLGLDNVSSSLSSSSSSVVERLLVLLLEKLIGLFKSTLRVETVTTAAGDALQEQQPQQTIHVVDCGRNVFRKRVYARLCSDIRTLLVHPRVAGQVILGSFQEIQHETVAGAEPPELRLRDGDKSVFALLIQAYECLQQMDLQQRHEQHHIEFESQSWTFAFVVDYEMNLLLSAFLAGLPYCFPDQEQVQEQDTDRVSTPAKWAVACGLIAPLRQALVRWSRKTDAGGGGNADNGETTTYQNDLVEGRQTGLLAMAQLDEAARSTRTSICTKKSSFHLPLHHMFAAIFQSVCAIVEPRSVHDWKRLLFSYDRDEDKNDYTSEWRRGELAFLYHVATPPLRVAMFAREIKAGVWVRNGNAMWQQLVHYYAKHWRFFGVHGDRFVSQLSALLLPRGSVTRMVLRQQLPICSSLLRLQQQPHAPVAHHETELLEETLRFLTQLVLSPVPQFPCSSSISSEDSATWRLQREMMHWLTLGPFSRSDVVAHVDMKLVEHVRQMPRHEWYLLEEEEIVGHVLETVGDYDDPTASCSGGSARDAGNGGGDSATALGFGMKMSGSWRLKRALWREISPLFECFSPSEAQQCEQNLKKELMRQRVRVDDACVLPVPQIDTTGGGTEGSSREYYASARALAAQVLNSSSLLGVVMLVLHNWRQSDDGDASVAGGTTRSSGGERRATPSESLLVAAVHCLSVAVRLLEGDQGEELDDGEGEDCNGDCECESVDAIEPLAKCTAALNRKSRFVSKLCCEVEVDGNEDGTTAMSLLSLLSLVACAVSVSPDTRALAQTVIDRAVLESRRCREYMETKRLVAMRRVASVDTVGSDHDERASATADTQQQLAKEVMRRRQQEILAKMRSQQLQFLTSQIDDAEDDDKDALAIGERSMMSRALGLNDPVGVVGKIKDDEGYGYNDEEEVGEDDDGDDASVGTEDDEEEDEWGFPTGHIELELYVSHLSSAIALISERERRKTQQRLQRVRRRTRSKVRADSVGSGCSSSSSPSVSARADIAHREAARDDEAVPAAPVASDEQKEEEEEEEEHECALCRMPCESGGDSDGDVSTFGFVAMIQPTGLPRKLAICAEGSQLPPLPWTSVDQQHKQQQSGGDAVVWTCGHAVHHACIKAYVDSLWQQQRSARRNPLEALHQQHGDERLLSERELEFLCPVCRRLSNCLLPDVTALLQVCKLPLLSTSQRHGSGRHRRRLPSDAAAGASSSFSSFAHSSGGDERNDVARSGPCTFPQWLTTNMQPTFLSPPPPTQQSNSRRRQQRKFSDAASHDQDDDNSQVVVAVRKRTVQFCRQLTHRGVQAALQLPLLLAGGAPDELVVDAELRHLTDTWKLQFTDWQLLLRCLEVELDVTLHERTLGSTTSSIPTGWRPGRTRLQSLRLLSQLCVAAAIVSRTKSGDREEDEDSDDRDGHHHQRDGGAAARLALDDRVAATSDVLFGRRVLFAEDDDNEDEDTHHGSCAVPPLLAHPHLFGVFNERLVALLATAATTAITTSSAVDYRYSEELLQDVFFSARTLVTAQILQALCSAVLVLPSPSSVVASSSDDTTVSSPRNASRAVVSDFRDVETLGDALQWAHQLMLRCRLVAVDAPAKWEMAIVEEHVVSHLLPVLRRLVLLVQVSLPRVLDGDGDGDSGDRSGLDNDPCALCGELDQQTTNASNGTGSGAIKPARLELRALLRRLHLPPLRLLFRHFVFAPQQRELCQLWAAQLESKAAVLRCHGGSDLPSSGAIPAATKLLVPTTLSRPRKRVFIDLPRVYMDLFIQYNDKPRGVCQRCHQLPQHPAICLFCGDVLCCFSPCCEANTTPFAGSSTTTTSIQGGRIGECTQHAQSCGLGTGAFLLLRACTVILFLGNERRCVWGSLYVDKNGEEDPYLRRGKTLLLATNRLRALETLLVSHGFAQNTAILANTSRRDGRRY